MVKRVLMMAIVAVFALAGCDSDGGGSSGDANAAQSYFPSINGYTVHQTENVQAAISSGIGAAAFTANPALGLVVERIDSLLSCYRGVGAVDARAYVENIGINQINERRIPRAGALVVINQDRLRENFLSCAASQPLEGVFNSQTVVPEPCTGAGTFTRNEDTFSYAYVASDKPLCDQYDQYFAQFQ